MDSKDDISTNNDNVHELNNMVKKVLTIPRGTKDYLPEEMYIKNEIISTIKTVFEKHGAVAIDTPTYERKEILLGKYGDQQKLVFDLEDQKNTICSLRYDLTVPLARYMAMNNIYRIKRYHIGKVFRRDEPSIKQGRLREFYQCDIDITGECSHVMLQDAEIIKIMADVYNRFGFKFIIKLNHKQLLEINLIDSGVTIDNIQTVASSIDKLDKHSWEYVANELKSKGLNDDTIINIANFVNIKYQNPYDLINYLQSKQNIQIRLIGSELKILFDYLNCYNCLQHIKIDMGLARGLDYYTGVIFEAICIDNELDVGSIGGGGRYDNLIGMYADRRIPAVGVGIGVERIFSIIKHIEEKKARDRNINMKTIDIDYYIVVMQNKHNVELNTSIHMYALKILGMLWDSDIKIDICQDITKPIKDQIIEAIKKNCKYVLIIGENEYTNNNISIKNVTTREQFIVNKDDIINHVKICTQKN